MAAALMAATVPRKARRLVLLASRAVWPLDCCAFGTNATVESSQSSNELPPWICGASYERMDAIIAIASFIVRVLGRDAK